MENIKFYLQNGMICCIVFVRVRKMSNNNIEKMNNAIKKSKQCLLTVFAPLISAINIIIFNTFIFERNT